jgi:hypothetical protein
MHGLVSKAFQSFLSDTFGEPAWQAVLHRSGLWDSVGPEGFDPLHVYGPEVGPAILSAAAAELGRPGEQLLEDMGIYLVSNPRTERLRRLLRFGGLTFTEVLGSLDDLPGRARLAVPDLDLPEIALDPAGDGRFVLTFRDCMPGFAQVMMGILRTLADDYGALVVIEAAEPAQALPPASDERLVLVVHDPDFHAGRAFDLADPTVAA